MGFVTAKRILSPQSILLFLCLSLFVTQSYTGTSASSTYTISGYCYNTINQVGFYDTPGVASKLVVKGNFAYAVSIVP